jgi:hypothetical protein
VSEKAEEQDRLDRDRERSTEAHWQAAEAGAEQEPEHETPKRHDAPVPKRDDDEDDERKLVPLEEDP